MDQFVASVPLAVRFFGGAAIEEAGRPVSSRAGHRHPLALLAILATAPGHSMSRDKLMALLWPEADPSSLRHRLSVTVYEIRRALGREAVVSVQDGLRLDTEAVWIDVTRFEDAIARGDRAEAIELHRGPFLDGFHVPDSAEFAEWAAAERERLDRAYVRALEASARDAEREGDLPAAVRCWRKAVAQDPYGSRALLGLMGALDAAGERGEALRAAERQARSMGKELGASQDPAVVALAARIRNGEGGPSRPPVVAEPSVRGDLPVAGRESAAAPSPRGRPRRVVIVAAVAATLLLLTLPWIPTPGGSADEVVPDRVVVLPFVVRGSAEFAYLGEGMAEILGTTLDGVGTLRTADPHAVLAFVKEEGLDPADPAAGRRTADRFRAGTYVRGTIVQSGDALVVHASLFDDEGRSLGTAEVTIPGEERILEGLDRLASQILVDHLGQRGDALTSDAALATRSLPALKAYLAGERAFRAARFEEASREFGRAAVEDSTFALASYRMSLANLWADRPQTQPFDIDQMALRHSARLPERPRLLIEAYVAWRAGDADRAERLYLRILAVYPDDVEALHQLGETLFHYNPVRGRSILEAREPFERVLRFQPNHWGALWHLAQLAALEGRTIEFERILARLERFDPTPTKALEIRALRTFTRGEAAAVDGLLPELRRADETVLASLATKIGVYLGDLDGAAKVAGLLTESNRPQRQRALGYEILAYLETTRGRPSVARAHLETLDRLDDRRATAMEARTFLSLLPVPKRANDLDTMRQALIRWEVSSVAPLREQEDRLRAYLLGLLNATWGDSIGALAQAAELASVDHPVSDARSAAVRAAVLRRGGRQADALSVLREGWRTEWFGWAVSSPGGSQAYERYVRAELTIEAGQLEEALRWLASFEEHGIFDLVYLAPSLLKRAEVYERMGRTTEAAQQYERFIALWKGCDPVLRPFVEEAKRKLALLPRHELVTGTDVRASP